LFSLGCFALQTGNRQIAGALIEHLEKSGTGFNFLHKQALLNDDAPFDQYKCVLHPARFVVFHAKSFTSFTKSSRRPLTLQNSISHQERRLFHYTNSLRCDEPQPQVRALIVY